MRTITLLFLSLIVLSCDEFGASKAKRLFQVEAHSYSGYVLHTNYGYDKEGRITTITNYKDDEEPEIAATISYKANEAIILSDPDFDPAYKQKSEVHLFLNAKGLTQKRIESTRWLGIAEFNLNSERFIYDTLLFEYDAAGFLKKTIRSRYDSTWFNSKSNSVRKVSSTATYTTQGGNLIAIDEYAVFPVISRDDNMTTVTEGSSEYHCVFNYTKAYPNKTDFKNAAVLNEYLQPYEGILNPNYKNMHDQYVSGNLPPIDIERIYNSDGLLSTVNIEPGHTQYTQTNFSYK
jgi:hypothetical protein